MLKRLIKKLRSRSTKQTDDAPLAGPPAKKRQADETANAKPPTIPIQRESPPEGKADGKVVQILNPRGDRVRYDCGHEDHRYFEIDLFGNVLRPNEEQGAPSLYCSACALAYFQASERCSLCGSAITPGDGVAFYSGGLNEDHTWPRSYIESDGERVYLGCLNMDCCPSGGFFGGHLTKDGVHALFGGNCAAGQAMATGETVIANP